MQSITFGWDTAKEHDQAVGHQLFDRHAGTQRTVEKLPDGIRTLTVSSDPVTVSLLHDHVSAMESRMRQGLVMRRWDPFFPELFRHADEIRQRIENQPDGVRVEAHSDNPYVVQLLYLHADAVSDFAKRGWDAAQVRHSLPAQTSEIGSVTEADFKSGPDPSSPAAGQGWGQGRPDGPMSCRGGGHGRGQGGLGRGNHRRGLGSEAVRR